jgi:hypothetical protein
VTTHAGTFDHCIHVVETSDLEHKWYAAGVGQVKDGKLALPAYARQ